MTEKHQSPDLDQPHKKSPSDSQWNTLRDVEFSGSKSNLQNTTSEDEMELITPNFRQQRKLIQAISSGDHRALGLPDVKVDDEDQKFVLSALKHHAVSESYLNSIISNISSPIDQKGPDLVYANMAQSKHERRILAKMINLGFHNYQSVNAESVEKFNELYPNPVDFEEASRVFLDDIKSANPHKKYQEYIQAMHSFKHLIYGKKQEYYDQLKLLKKQAEAFDEQDYLSEKYLAHAISEGDPYSYRGQEYMIAPENIFENHLEPRHELKTKGLEIGLSDIFKVGSRDACLAYVKTEEGVKIRSYYRSRSAALWRYLPDYVAEGDKISYYGKAGEEEKLTLPAELQAKLSEIGTVNDKIVLNPVTAEFFLCAPAKRYNPRDYDNAYDYNSFKGAYYQETSPTPAYDFGSLSNHKQPPETIDVKGQLSPDYERPIGSFTLADHPYYGKIKTSLYASHNGELMYSLCETRKNGHREVWIGNIEKINSPLGSTGCYQDWVSSGDICTPLYEYGGQTSGYGDPSDTQGSYQNMWQNYLSKMPIIQRYLDQTPHD